MKRVFILDNDTHRANFMAWLAKLDIAKPFRVTVQEDKGERSNRANARHRLLMGVAAEHAGMTNEEMHQEMLMRYFGEKQVTTAWGTVLRRPVRTTTTNEQGERDVLDSAAFMRFAEFAEGFVIEHLGVWLDQREAA